MLHRVEVERSFLGSMLHRVEAIAISLTSVYRLEPYRNTICTFNIYSNDFPLIFMNV